MELIIRNSKMFSSENLVQLIKELRILKSNNPFLQTYKICNFKILKLNCFLNHNKFQNQKYQVVKKLEKRILILLLEIQFRVYQHHYKIIKISQIIVQTKQI